MSIKNSSIHLASEGSFDTVSTDSLTEMRSLVAEYAEDPNGAVLDDWEPREGTIITEVRAISARINQNYDAWPSEELREAHHTFIGKPVFVNHMNHDPDRARGRVVASRYVDAGEHDRYIQVLQEVEASRFPMLAKELMEGGLDSVSMGAEAREVECSYCGNISTSPFDACEHIPLKGSYLQRRTASGTPEDILVYEICRKISFFELSYVFDPADETAVASNVLVAGRHEAANEVEAPPKVDTLHPDEDEKSQDDWQEFVDDPNVIDTIDVLDEPDLGLNQELDRADDELPEGFEEFADVDDRIEENEQAERELAQDAREKSQEKADAEAEKAQEQFEQAEPDPEDDKNWEDEDDGAGGTSSRFKGGGIEALVADDYGTFNMWVEKNGSLIASDSYTSLQEAKEAAISVAKQHRAEWAGYRDFEDCKQQNSNADDPDAYCGEIKNRADKESKMSRTTGRNLRRATFAPGDRVKNEHDNVSGTVVVTDPDSGEVTVDWEDGETTTERRDNLVQAARRKVAQAGQFQEIDAGKEGFPGSRMWEYWPMFASGRGLVLDEDSEGFTFMWMIEDASGSFVKTEFANSLQEAMQAVDDYYHNTASRKENKVPRTSHRKKSDKDLYVRFLEYAKNRGFDLEHIENLYMSGQETSDVHQFEEAMYDFLDVDSVDDDPRLYELLEAPGIYGISGHILGKRTIRKQAENETGEVCVDCLMIIANDDDSGMSAEQAEASRAGIADWRAEGYTVVANDFEDPSFGSFPCEVCGSRDGGDRFPVTFMKISSASRKQSSNYGPNNYDTAKDAFEAYLADEGVSKDDSGPYFNTFESLVSGEWTSEDLDFDLSSVGKTSRHNGSRRNSRMNNRATSRRSNRMAPQRRRRTGGENKQTPLLEDTGIAQTPAEEPAVDVETGGDAPNNSESDRVKSARRALAREMARDRAIKARRRKQAYNGWSNWDTWNASLWLNNDQGLYNEALGKSASELRALVEDFGVTGDGFDVDAVNWDEVAEGFNDEAHYARRRPARRRQAAPVGADLSGANVDREDLFENYPATTMTAKVRNRFAAWVHANYGCDLREASGPGELRSWARAFSREADIELPRLHAAIKRDVIALRTAADDDDKDDIPDFIEEKIESDEDNPSEDDVEKAKDDDKKESARRRAAARRAAMQARRGRGRTKTTRRRTADDKLDLAAPDDRVNVEKPTSGTTDADAEASQFDKADFDNNSGKGLENPDTTPAAGTPGGPSVNDLKRSSRATGLQAVRLAEAMIAAGLIEDSTEAKFKAAAQFEKMSRDIVLDRTALLEKVATVNAKRPSTTKNAGNRGSSLNSAVPPNMTGMTRSSAPQTREASSANDSDLFF